MSAWCIHAMVRAMSGMGQDLAETGAASVETGLGNSPLYLRIRDVLAEAIPATTIAPLGIVTPAIVMSSRA